MHELLRLAARFADTALIPPRPSLTGRVATIAALIPIVAGLGCAAIGFAVTGIWLHLAPEVGSADASLIVAAILLLGCIVASAAIYYSYRGPRQPASPPAPAVNVQSIVNEASDLVRAHKTTLLLAAFVAGLLTEQNKR